MKKIEEMDEFTDFGNIFQHMDRGVIFYCIFVVSSICSLGGIWLGKTSSWCDDNMC